jgi:mxaJ protein
MCSRFLSVFTFLLVALTATAQLRVCADPDNLPFSNHKQQGFENRIAEIIARDLNEKVEYTWQRMGRGFVRNILNKHACDVVLGVPTGFHPVLTTLPYYRSTYVFVTRRNASPLTTFDDPRLKKIKVGVQIVSEEYAPPAIALGRRGLVANIVGFETSDSPGAIVSAVLRNQVGAAVVWGPTAGYFAKPNRAKLAVEPTPPADPPNLPLTFAISMGVRKTDTALRDRLNQVLSNRKPEINRILHSYGVPLVQEKTDARSSD